MATRTAERLVGCVTGGSNENALPDEELFGLTVLQELRTEAAIVSAVAVIIWAILFMTPLVLIYLKKRQPISLSRIKITLKPLPVRSPGSYKFGRSTPKFLPLRASSKHDYHPLIHIRIQHKGYRWFACPLLNSTGMAVGTRENLQGLDLNRD